tara:strand:+ start:251 stop:454 length:204 start_codon:yes stop_codon:yes gene_type:complete
MGKMSTLDWATMLLLVVGGLNWGLVGLFNLDVIATVFGGSTSLISRAVYVLVGLSALYALVKTFGKR